MKELTAKKLKQRLDKYLLTHLGQFPIIQITVPRLLRLFNLLQNAGQACNHWAYMSKC
nr:hypothetical protein [Psychromonas marina]